MPALPQPQGKKSEAMCKVIHNGYMSRAARKLRRRRCREQAGQVLHKLSLQNSQRRGMRAKKRED